MSDGGTEQRSLLRQALGRQGGAERHPSVEAIEAFHWGDLPADQADEVRAHLGVCLRCLDLMARLDEVEAAAAGGETVVPAGEGERSLARLKERLRTEAGPAEATVRPSRTPRGPLPPYRPRPFPHWSAAPGPYAMAVTLLVAGAGLALWLAASLARERGRIPELESRLAAATARTSAVAEELAAARDQAELFAGQAAALREERDQLLAPHPNTPIIDLRASGERGGAGEEVEEIPIAPGVRFVTLVLEDPEQATLAAYRARVLTSQALPVLEVEGLRRTVYGNFVLTLSARVLPRGECLVLLEGRRGERWDLLARYRVRLLW
jgi:hypothetical protein